jgi:hypothetical protein
MGLSTMHAQIIEYEEAAKKKRWDYWVWVLKGKKRSLRTGHSSKNLADAKRGILELLREADDVALVELPAAL